MIARAQNNSAAALPVPAHQVVTTDPGRVSDDVQGDAQRTSVLLVEDDPADALLVQELAADGVPEVRLDWVRSLAAAREWFADRLPDCVLLDLHLPDAHGLETLAQIREFADQVPIVVMTGLGHEQTGFAAVASGAQDYLVKGGLEPELFGRAVRYAIQRKQTERTTAALQLNAIRARENARLERGLLPKPLLRGAGGIEIESRYRPGRKHSLLGGDFYDVVQDPDGTLHAVIGDVAGHGPDAAATGVALRLAWRTLVLSGITGPRQLGLLEQVLIAERTDPSTFATVTTLCVHPRDRRVQVLRAGHPGILLHSEHGTTWTEVAGGPALGFVPGRARWPECELTLPAATGLVLFTDGLFEGHTGNGDERLGEEGLLALARSVEAVQPAEFIDELISRAEDLARSSGGLDDDVAVVYLRWKPE